MTDTMDVDVPVNVPAHNFELAQTDDSVLAFVLWCLADGATSRSESHTSISFNTIESLKMYDLRPLLLSCKYDEVVDRVLERISIGEYIPYQ